MPQLYETNQNIQVPPFYDYTSYMRGFTTPSGGSGGALNEYQEKTVQGIYDNIAELEAKRADQLAIYYEHYQKQNAAAMQAFTEVLQGMAEFAKAQGTATLARGDYLGGIDSPFAQAAARWYFSPSDPAALSSANGKVADAGKTAQDQLAALKAQGVPITPEMLLDQTTASLTEMENSLRDAVGTAQSPDFRLGTARDVERQIIEEADRVARASGMSTEQQVAYMQAVRARVQGASLAAIPPEERAAYNETREAGAQLVADRHQVAETLRVPGGDSSKAAAMEAAWRTIEEQTSPQAQMQRQQLYQSMVNPELDGQLAGYRRALDQMLGGQVDPLTGALADFAKDHPWYQEWAQAMHFPDHAFAANWLVKRPELVSQMDSFYKNNEALFSRARHNLDAERELRQALKQEGRELRQAGEASPAFQTNSVVRTLDDMFRRKQLSRLPSADDPQSWGSAFTQGYEEEVKKRDQLQDYISVPPGSVKDTPAVTPEGGIQAPKAPSAPLPPGVTEADRQRMQAQQRAKDQEAARQREAEAARKRAEAVRSAVPRAGTSVPVGPE